MSDTDTEGSTDSLNHPIYNTLSNFFIGNQLEYFDKHGYPPRFSHYNLSSKTDTDGYEHQSKVSLTPYNWQWNEILICTSLYQSIEVYATPSQSSKLPITLQSTRHSHNAQRSLAIRNLTHAKVNYIFDTVPRSLSTCQIAQVIAKQSMRDARHAEGQWTQRTGRQP